MTGIGQVIRELRQARGWFQVDLAREAKIRGNSTLFRIETGKTKNPDPETLRHIATALGFTDSELLDFTRNWAAVKARVLAKVRSEVEAKARGSPPGQRTAKGIRRASSN